MSRVNVTAPEDHGKSRPATTSQIQPRPATTCDGHPRPVSASYVQPRPVTTSQGQSRPAKASHDQPRPVTTSHGQSRPATASHVQLLPVMRVASTEKRLAYIISTSANEKILDNHNIPLYLYAIILNFDRSTHERKKIYDIFSHKHTSYMT